MKWIARGNGVHIVEIPDKEYAILKEAESAINREISFGIPMDTDLSPFFKKLSILSFNVNALTKLQTAFDALKREFLLKDQSKIEVTK